MFLLLLIAAAATTTWAFRKHRARAAAEAKARRVRATAANLRILAALLKGGNSEAQGLVASGQLHQAVEFAACLTS